MTRGVPRVLSIAGSDSGGGAGIQADLKAFAACGVHGMTAITAITAQNTVAVEAVSQVPPEMILAQVRAVQEDIGVDAVKVGMLGTAETVAAVEQALMLLRPAPAVIDPVMVAESGAELLAPDAAAALVGRLLPLAAVITPNLAEARALLRAAGTDLPPAEEGPGPLAVALRGLGPAAVVVTGGHLEEATDTFYDGERMVAIPGERHPDGAAHGSGCTHSAALAAGLAHGLDPLEAARLAKRIAGAAVQGGLRGLGSGPGPVDALAVAGRNPLA